MPVVRLQMELAELPDELLLQVLSWLDTRQLLRARRVCRKWNSLALDPDAWRQRDLECFDEDAYGAALRRAPCARSLSVVERHWELAASTNCAAHKLAVTVRVLSDTNMVRATDVVRRQVQLGRLKDLSVSFCYGSGGGRQEFMSLMQVVNSANALVRFSIDHTLPIYELIEANAFRCPASRPPFGPLAGPSPHLKHLTYSSSLQDAGVESLLRHHASTIEVARLQNRVGSLNFSHLPAFPNLRCLECPVMEGMESLLQCPELESVKLTIDVPEHREHKQPGLGGVHRFLRDATQLKSLVFVYGNFDKREADLVLSVAASNSTRLQALEFMTFCYSRYLPKDGRDLLQRHLCLVLPKLPRLTKLVLGFPPSSDLLASISPRSAPSLQQLTCDFAWEAGLCGHCWWHSAEVQTLLERHPRLHLVTERYIRCCGKGFCVKGCHQLPPGKVGSSWHADGDSYSCASMLGHGDTSVNWIKI